MAVAFSLNLVDGCRVLPCRYMARRFLNERRQALGQVHETLFVDVHAPRLAQCLVHLSPLWIFRRRLEEFHCFDLRADVDECGYVIIHEPFARVHD